MRTAESDRGVRQRQPSSWLPASCWSKQWLLQAWARTPQSVVPQLAARTSWSPQAVGGSKWGELDELGRLGSILSDVVNEDGNAAEFEEAEEVLCVAFPASDETPRGRTRPEIGEALTGLRRSLRKRLGNAARPRECSIGPGDRRHRGGDRDYLPVLRRLKEYDRHITVCRCARALQATCGSS